ncbi:hypothetical protein CPter91_3914 [Collimonas pratensis]|uniref:Uncharacterized protein n=1 Tax=Collimonas pratensis TaxID=279113 RepID=A0A127Q8Q3_9BURK|nr:hypothetical protein CPter91_3914 [Collimonas pratensis]
MSVLFLWLDVIGRESEWFIWRKPQKNKAKIHNLPQIRKLLIY